MNFLPRIDRFCCCSLKIVACVIGNVEIILGLASVVDDYFDLRESNLKEMLVIVMIGYIMDFVIVLLEVVASVLLVVGVKGGYLWLVRFWLYIHAFLFLGILAIYLGSTLVPITAQNLHFVHFRVFFLMYTVRTLIVYIFFILVVNSYYYKALSDENEIDDDIE